MKIIASNRSETVKSESGSWKRWLILFFYFLLNAEMAFQVRSFGIFFLISKIIMLTGDFKMFMFQPISSVIADYYNVTDNQVIWLAQE